MLGTIPDAGTEQRTKQEMILASRECRVYRVRESAGKQMLTDGAKWYGESEAGGQLGEAVCVSRVAVLRRVMERGFQQGDSEHRPGGCKEQSIAGGEWAWGSRQNSRNSKCQGPEWES